ncbi:MAG: acyl-CoA dehydrogenase family protein [Maricaulaceae bacterium]
MSTNFGQIGFTEEQIEMLTVAESFCRDKSPIETVRKHIESDLGYDADIWAEMGALGWLAIAIPEGYEGVGLSMTEVVPVCEQLGRRMMATPFQTTTLAAQALIAGGTDTQKSEILPKIAAGTAATLALTEDNGDWDLANINAAATSDGKDGYILSGTKTFVIHLASAQWVIVSVMIEGEARLVIVPKSDVPEDNIRRENIIDETQRSFELVLDGIHVEDSQVMTLETTPSTLKYIELCANLIAAGDITGACQSTIDYIVEYLGTRKQFGKLIGSFQALKHPTVDAFVDYQKSRSLLYSAAFSFAKQGEGEIAARMAKVQSIEALSFAADRAIQFHGGFGFTYDCDAQLYRRRALFQASQFGDASYHKKKLADLLL